MIVREYTDADLARIKILHRQSDFNYSLPDLSSQEFFSRRVIGDSDSFGMASFMRLTAEVYLVCDPAWRTPAWRSEALRQLSVVCNEDARCQGVKEVVGFLPPQIARKFGGRLKRLGWSFYKGEDWKCCTHEVT